MNEFIKKYKDYKFGSLTVIGPEEYEMDKDMNIVQKNVYCHCDCGKQWVLVDINDLLNGITISCGCQGTYRRVINSGNLRHGDSKENSIYYELYNSWSNMRSTTRFKIKNGIWPSDITITPEWDTYLSFKKWALENDWACGKVIKRIDPSKGYNPDNCFWGY